MTFPYTALTVFKYTRWQMDDPRLLFIRYINDAWDFVTVDSWPGTYADGAYSFPSGPLMCAQNWGNTFLITTSDNYAYRSEDSGDTWEAIDPPGHQIIWMDAHDGKFIAICAPSNFSKLYTIVSDDYGDTWTVQDDLPAGINDGAWSWSANCASFDDTTGTLHVAVLNSSEVVVYSKSDDLGETWSEPVNVSGFSYEYYNYITGVMANDGIVCIGLITETRWDGVDSFQVGHSSDNGDSWSVYSTGCTLEAGWATLEIWEGYSMAMDEERVSLIMEGVFNENGSAPYPYTSATCKYTNYAVHFDYRNAEFAGYVTVTDGEGGGSGGTIAGFAQNQDRQCQINAYNIIPIGIPNSGLNEWYWERTPPYNTHFWLTSIRSYEFSGSAYTVTDIWGEDGPVPFVIPGGIVGAQYGAGPHGFYPPYAEDNYAYSNRSWRWEPIARFSPWRGGASIVVSGSPEYHPTLFHNFATSKDANTWTSYYTDTMRSASKLFYRKGVYLANCYDYYGTYPNRIARSINGTTWTGLGNLGYASNVYAGGFWYFKGRFYLGYMNYDDGFILASENGLTWSQVASGFRGRYYASTEDIMVAVGSRNRNQTGVIPMWWTEDGDTFTRGTVPGNPYVAPMHTVAYGDDKFVALGYYYTQNNGAYSYDGKEWATFSAFVNEDPNVVMYANGQWLAGTYRTDYGPTLWRSDNGISWEGVGQPFYDAVTDIAWHEGLGIYIAVGVAHGSAGGATIKWSEDGTNWISPESEDPFIDHSDPQKYGEAWAVCVNEDAPYGKLKKLLALLGPIVWSF
jgi:hypothetical protein